MARIPRILIENNHLKSQYEKVKHLLKSKGEKTPKLIDGLDGVYSLKRLAESV